MPNADALPNESNAPSHLSRQTRLCPGVWEDEEAEGEWWEDKAVLGGCLPWGYDKWHFVITLHLNDLAIHFHFSEKVHDNRLIIVYYAECNSAAQVHTYM